MSPELLPVSLTSAPYFQSLEERLLEAFKNRNLDQISELIDDRCMGVGIHGKEYSKADFLEELYNSVNVSAFEVKSMKVIEEDGFAVILANWEVDMKLGNAIIRGRIRATRTWIRRPDGWKMISFHLTDARLASAWEDLLKS